MEIILDLEPVDEMYNRVPDLSLLEPSAELLYGLIHQRYILTKQGMFQMVYCQKEQWHGSRKIRTDNNLNLVREIRVWTFWKMPTILL